MRIQFIGGPGVGKSTVSAIVFGELKKRGLNIELIQEYVKNWAYLKRSIFKHDQIYLFGTQLHKEFTLLNNSVKHIVTDCPIVLGAMYTEYGFSADIANPLYSLAQEFEKDYPSITIVLSKPEDQEYQVEGRYQSQDESNSLHKFILEKSDIYLTNKAWFNNNQIDEIVEFILTQVD